VDVADLRQGKALQRGRQALDGHVDPDHGRSAPRIQKTQQRDQHAQQRHGFGRGDAQPGQRQAAGRQPIGQPQQQQTGIARDRQHQHGREQAHEEQAHPGQHVGERLFGDAPGHQAQRHQQGRQHQARDQQPLAGGVGVKPRHKACADVNMEQRGYKRQRQKVHEMSRVMSPAYGCMPHAFNAGAAFGDGRRRRTKAVRDARKRFMRSQVRQSVRRNTPHRRLPSALLFHCRIPAGLLLPMRL
jgi:hypothetical protein